MNPRRDLAARIYQTSNLHGEFVLRSGATSSEYFDKYLFEADPNLLEDICASMQELIPSETEILAGLEMGGIPLVTLLSHLTGIPALFVRKKSKTYGTCKLAEGGEVKGRRITLVEDVITSGGQGILSGLALRTLGAQIDTILCVIDREAGGRSKLIAEGLDLRSLFTMSELKAAAGVPE